MSEGHSLSAAIADPMTALMYQALASDRGIVIQVSDSRLALGRISNIKDALADEDLRCVLARASPTVPGQLWLMKRPRTEVKVDDNRE